MPGQIRSKFGVALFGGKTVRAFPWKDHGTKAPIAQLWGASTKVGDLFSAAQAKFAAIDASPDYTPSGRSSAKLEWARANAAALKEAAAALREGEAALKNFRSRMTGPTLDKSDVVGQMRQAEVRAFLRLLPDLERNRLLIDLPTDQIEPEIAAAVTAAPAMLSGVSNVQREKLIERAMAARHPVEAEQVELITAASEALADVVDVSTEMLRRSGFSADHVNELSGDPTFAEKIAGMMPAGD